MSSWCPVMMSAAMACVVIIVEASGCRHHAGCQCTTVLASDMRWHLVVTFVQSCLKLEGVGYQAFLQPWSSCVEDAAAEGCLGLTTNISSIPRMYMYIHITQEALNSHSILCDRKLTCLRTCITRSRTICCSLCAKLETTEQAQISR